MKRPAIVGRLFYHLTCILLTKIHPIETELSPNLREMQERHAYDTCGIIAHVKDRYAFPPSQAASHTNSLCYM